MKGSCKSYEAGRLCRLDNRQCQFFPGQTLSWLDALADVDMMWSRRGKMGFAVSIWGGIPGTSFSKCQH